MSDTETLSNTERQRFEVGVAIVFALLAGVWAASSAAGASMLLGDLGIAMALIVGIVVYLGIRAFCTVSPDSPQTAGARHATLVGALLMGPAATAMSYPLWNLWLGGGDAPSHVVRETLWVYLDAGMTDVAVGAVLSIIVGLAGVAFAACAILTAETASWRTLAFGVVLGVASIVSWAAVGAILLCTYRHPSDGRRHMLAMLMLTQSLTYGLANWTLWQAVMSPVVF